MHTLRGYFHACVAILRRQRLAALIDQLSPWRTTPSYRAGAYQPLWFYLFTGFFSGVNFRTLARVINAPCRVYDYYPSGLVRELRQHDKCRAGAPAVDLHACWRCSSYTTPVGGAWHRRDQGLDPSMHNFAWATRIARWRKKAFPLLFRSGLTLPRRCRNSS